MKNSVSWDMAPCGSYKNQSFGETINQNMLLGLLVTAKAVPISILVNVMLDETRSSETLLFTKATRRNIPEDGIVDIFINQGSALVQFA
jgi:hypothetical protein